LSKSPWTPDYSKLADTYDKYRRLKPVDRLILDRLIQLADIRREREVSLLEIGCGTGNYITPLSPLIEKGIGLDVSKHMIQRAFERCREALFILADAAAVPLIPEAFDVVIAVLVIHQIWKGNRSTVFREAFRVLKPGGKLLTVTFDPAFLREHPYSLFPGVLEIDLKRFCPVSELEGLLRQAGFRQVNSEEILMEMKYSSKGLLESARKKLISTVALLPEEKFKSGLGEFKQRLLSKYGEDEFPFTYKRIILVANK